MPTRTTTELRSGAEGRWTNPASRRSVVCVNGGTAAEVPGTWSASIEWLVGALAPRHSSLGFLEVRYRVKSWRRLELCIEDTQAAIAAAKDTPDLLRISAGNYGGRLGKSFIYLDPAKQPA